MRASRFFLHSHHRRAAALIIALAFVVLLSGVVLAFFARSTSGRLLSSSSIATSKVDNLCLSALNIITADLKQEIVNGSTALTSGNYVPTSATYMLPQRSGNPSYTGTDPIPNLVRISSSAADGKITAGSPLVASRASASVTTSNSSNGRNISLTRWNKHYLIPRDPAKYSATSMAFGTEPVTSFTAPDWVYVTTQGPKVLTTATTSVVGRYAYAIYDEGGLLDANVAGFPTSGGTQAVAAGGKGSIATADLTTIGLTTAQINTLVGWRNYATTQPGGTLDTGFSFSSDAVDRYFSMIATNNYGFMKVANSAYNNRTDQAFISRQQLLTFWKTRSLPPNALQYLSTFSRECNAPSWSPLYNASDLGGSGTAYKSDATKSGQINPNFQTQVFTVSPGKSLTVYAADGTASTIYVKKGEPIVRRRFSLQKLSWLTCSGPKSSISNAAIKQCFGLVWNSSAYSWTYVSPDGSSAATSIKTLEQVAALNREPDFFELIKATILAGSLGKDGGKKGTAIATGPIGDTYDYDRTLDYQVLQIGANIIDQYDSDSYPTEIVTNIGPVTAPLSIYGTENLPYLIRMYVAAYCDTSNNHLFRGLLVPEIWNPHQQPTTAASGPAPTQFAFAGSKGLTTMKIYSYVTTLASTVYTAPSVSVYNSTPVTFTINPTEPTVLTQDNASSSDSKNKITSLAFHHVQNTWTNSAVAQWFVNDVASNKAIGLYAGEITLPGTENYAYFDQNNIVISGVSVSLMYKNDLDGQWHEYSRLKQIDSYLHGATFVDINNPVQKDVFLYYSKSDPRTDRFSVSDTYQASTTTNSGIPNKTEWQSWSTVAEPVPSHPPNNSFSYKIGTTTSADNSSNNSANAHSMLVQNRTDAQLSPNNFNVYYTDVDGVVRRAEGAYAVKTAQDGVPVFNNNMSSRPIVLNRPFRTVAELGYAYRDLPWKNLDFFTPESADSGLLDVFSVDDGDIVAGRVSLNTRQQKILQSLLSGANKTELSTTPTTISAAEAQTISTTIVNASATQPFMNRAEIINRFKASSNDGDSRFSSKTLLALNTASENRIKTQRESIARALGDATTTRTWNLLIDVVAQTGKFPTGTTALDKFVVDGERRYWLHVAIDRFTGKVVDYNLEPVYE